MARGLLRKTSFNKMVGAYRSQWKRFWMRLFTFGMYGRKRRGWWRDPKKAWYNWLYHRNSISIPHLLGYRPSRLTVFCAIFVASVIGVFAAPVDATRAGVKAHKIKTEKKARSESSGTRSSISTNRTMSGNTCTSYSASSTISGLESSNESIIKASNSRTASFDTPNTISTISTVKPQSSKTPTPKTTYIPPVKPIEEKPNTTIALSTSTYSYEQTKPLTPPKPEIKELDESTNKSTPKHETDQYIRKRMIIAGSSYCDKNILNRLSIGSYLEIVAEPTNPYDKDAVMLMYEGQKVGYISKQDNLPFVTCLRLNRNIYGVITDIITEQYPTKYEFEVWFNSVK